MNPPHHDDYLNAQMHEYHSEGPAPAHHLPFDRLLPVPASFASAGELGEYMPQEDLASVADVPIGDAPGSDPAADGDDEDVHVAHPDDVEVQLAVSDERHMYVPHGEDREVFLGDVHVIDVRGGVDSAVVVGDEDVDETVITAEHEIPIEAQAGDVEAPEPAVPDEETQREEMLVQETEEEGTQEEERREEEMRAEMTDEVEHEEMVPDEMAPAEMAPEAMAAGGVVHEEVAHEAMASAEVTQEEVAHQEEMHEAVMHEEGTHEEETHDIHAHDGQAHDAAADSHTDQAHMDGEHMFEGEAHEEHAHSEPAGAEHEHAAAAQYEETDHHADAHVEHHMEQHMAQHDEHHGDGAHEDEAEPVHAGHAVAEEREVPVPVSAMHDDAQDDAHDSARDDATGTESHGGNGAPTTQQAMSMAHASAHASGGAPVEHVSSAMEARGMLEGVAQSLRALAARDANGEGIVVFPRGVDVLEVRMHISRERDIDLNFRVAGPTLPSTSV